MRWLVLMLAWCVLLVVCWPLAIAALALLPLFCLLWLLVLPFRVLMLVIEAALALLRAVLFLPARLLGGPPTGARRL